MDDGRRSVPEVETVGEGEFIRVIDGRFTDFHGKVTDVDAEQGKLTALVNLFGRETAIELDLVQVERLAHG